MKKAILPVLLAATLTLAVTPVQAVESTAAATVAQKRDALRTLISDKRETMVSNLEDRKAKVASRAAALRTRLQSFKDKKKAAVVEKVNTRLEKINETRTDIFLKRLEKMESILAKLQEVVTKASTSGKDVAAAQAAIDASKQAIVDARTAVNTQADKDYSIKVTQEATVRADAKAARDMLHTDVEATKKLVNDAKKSVADAVMTVATTVRGEKAMEGQQ